MSANITLNSQGQAEIVTGNNQKAWHGLGETVQGLLTMSEAVRKSHLDWQVEQHPIVCNGQEVKGYFGNCRMDDGRVLGVVKNRYEVVQNEQAFDWFDEILGAGNAHIDTMGSLGNGEVFWTAAQIPNNLFLNNGDELEKWVLLYSSHDGSKALTVQLTPIRVVCQNTLSMAFNKRKNVFSVRHTATWQDKKEQAAKALGLIGGYYDDLGAVLKSLQSQPMNGGQMERLTEVLLPAKEDGEVGTRLENRRNEINNLFQRGTGNSGKMRFDALNAVTEFESHKRETRGNNRSARLEYVIGGQKLGQRAMDILTDEVEFAKVTTPRTLTVAGLSI